MGEAWRRRMYSTEKLNKFHISTELKLYRGENVIEHFLTELFKEREQIVEFLKQNDQMVMTLENYKTLNFAKVLICLSDIFAKNKTDTKYRAHSFIDSFAFLDTSLENIF